MSVFNDEADEDDDWWRDQPDDWEDDEDFVDSDLYLPFSDEEEG